MFRVSINEIIAHDDMLDSLKLINPKLDLEVNTVGSFKFKIYSNNPSYENIHQLSTIVKVYQRDKLIFRGRVLEDTEDFDKAKQVDCEGELAFLLDSVFRPFNLTGRKISIKEFFELLIDNHNSQVKDFQKIKLGEITVEDENENINFSSESALKTWDIIKDKIIATYGGYLYVTYDENEMPILNYYEDFDKRSSQNVEFGKNLIDVNCLLSGADIKTACIPYGSKIKDSSGNETSERITIESVNNNCDYLINEEMAEIYGTIYADTEDVTWDDVTLPENLLTKAKKYLSESIKLKSTIEVKAVDLANTNANIENFKFCEYIELISIFHEIDEFYLLKQMSIDLSNFSNTTFILGETKKTLTDSTQSNNISASQLITQVKAIEGDYVNNQEVNEIIKQTLNDSTILSEIEEKYTNLEDKVGDLDTLKTSIKDNIVNSINCLKDELEKENFEQKILWSGAYYMNANQTITLSEAVSKQKNGIVLVWSGYQNGQAMNYDFTTQFISKKEVELYEGSGHFVVLGGSSGVYGTKYVYIKDLTISGNANNEGTRTYNGITYVNSNSVLRAVIGI